MIYRWFVIILTLSFIPVFIEFSKVQKNYEIVKRPHHRHHVISEVLSNELTKQHHRKKREKAIVESNTDYQVIIHISIVCFLSEIVQIRGSVVVNDFIISTISTL